MNDGPQKQILDDMIKEYNELKKATISAKEHEELARIKIMNQMIAMNVKKHFVEGVGQINYFDNQKSSRFDKAQMRALLVGLGLSEEKIESLFEQATMEISKRPFVKLTSEQQLQRFKASKKPGSKS